MKSRGRGRPRKAKENDDFLDTSQIDTTCSVCFAEFLDPEDLDIHVKQVHPSHDAKFFCIFCSKDLLHLEAYLLHIRNVHLSIMKCCSFCSRCFVDEVAFRDHEAKHELKRNMISCSQCSVMFQYNYALEEHETNEHPISQEGIMLQKYYAHFSSILNLKADNFFQSFNKDAVYHCTKCGNASSTLREYIKHLKTNKCVSYTCDNCYRVFKRKSEMVKHCNRCIGRCVNKKGIPIECDNCFKKIKCEKYKLHKKRCKAMKCNICDVKFTSLDLMITHQIQVHPNFATVRTCRYCQVDIVGSAALARHMTRVHQKDYHLYKYLCIYCQRIFKHPKKLFGHFFSTHKDIKPYTCKICDEKFMIRRKLTLHIKLKHDSKGFVEFDENFHVFFAKEKSVKPFNPPPNPSLYDENEAAELSQYDIPVNDVETDLNTDAENEQPNKTIDLETDSELQTATEAEDAANKTRKIVRTTKRKKVKSKTLHIDSEDSSDDEPLAKIVKKKRKQFTNIKSLQCHKCKKRCYTVQNYHQHMNSHFKFGSKVCIKCSKEFSTNTALQNHMKNDHSTSHITETLKRLIAKRKENQTGDENYRNETAADKIRKTIKKVNFDDEIPVQISIEPTNDMCVRNFISNFIPEDPKKGVILNTSVSIKPIQEPVSYKPKIKMVKFVEKHSPIMPGKIKYPHRFKKIHADDTKATFKIVTSNQGPKMNFIALESNTKYVNDHHYTSNYEDNYQSEQDGDSYVLPEVAEEVMLDNVENTPAPKKQTVLPPINIPNTAVGADKIQVAHLLPQAPFYKIVPLDKIIKTPREDAVEDVDLTLPSGIKLVNSNPLAHLLGEKTMELLAAKSQAKKYYKPKLNKSEAIALALEKLARGSVKSGQKSKK